LEALTMNGFRNIKLVLEYDGTAFRGFQRQPRARTVQAELEKALRRLFRNKVKIASASARTDAGVHAAGQVVHFKTRSPIKLSNIQRALNTYLPEDMAVAGVSEASAGFHARFDAVQKTYRYVVWNASARSPLRRHFSYHFPRALKLSAMRKAAHHLIGRHDFRSFQAKSDGRDSRRRIRRITIAKHAGEIVFEVTGDGFLYRMVRNIVGTLLMVGGGRLSLRDFNRLFRMRDRRHIGPTAPACGLSLVRVRST
jgi:tRNA pseudouridine38-40 synthase